MKKIQSIIYALIIFGVFGCDTFLEESPESLLSPSNFFTSEENVEIFLNGVYRPLSARDLGNPLGSYSQGLLAMGHMGTDQARFQANCCTGNSWALLDLFTYTASHSVTTQVWNMHYIGIARANSFIDTVEPLLDNPDFDTGEISRMLGEAHFLRALYYFNLVRFYGEVPLKLAALNGFNLNGAPRTSTLEVYKQIESDLLFAEQNLPLPSEIDATQNGRATKTAAAALLARVYLTWASPFPLGDNDKWEDALTYSSKLINGEYAGEHTLTSIVSSDDYGSIFRVENEGINNEYIFVVKFAQLDGFGTTAGATVGIKGDRVGAFTPNTRAATPNVMAEQIFHASFNPNDLRRDWTVSSFRVNAANEELPFTAGVNSVWYGLAKFRRDPAWSGWAISPVDYPLLRYSDVVLMHAEALFQTGSSTQAFEYLNKIRRRAFGEDPNTPSITPGVDLSAADGDFVNLLLDERSWELAGEDCLRWHDLVRYEELANAVAKKNVRTNVGSGQSYEQVSKFNSTTHRLFPIPQDEIDRNPAITVADQNPGY